MGRFRPRAQAAGGRHKSRRGTGSGAVQVSSRGQDSPKLLELAPTPSPPSSGFPSRLSRRLVCGFVIVCAWVWQTGRPAVGCPFCGVVGQSLAQRRDAADAVAVGEAMATATTDAEGFLAQPFRIDQWLGRRPAAAVSVGSVVPAEVPGPLAGTAMLFGTAADGARAPERLRWSALAADETLLGHVVAAPAFTAPAADRLRWFATRLEHPDSAIAADAFTEFALADYSAVRAAADAVDAKRLRDWLREPGVDPRRRGLYALLLGIHASRAAAGAEREANLSALRGFIDAPADDFRMGFDGGLAGFLVAEGERGLEALRQRGLFGPRGRPLDQRHLLAALRFAAESLGESIPRQQVAAATAALLASPAVAADAAIDLARYRHWDAWQDVAALWDSIGRDDPIVRRAVAGYLAACPLPEAARRLDDLRRRDPQLLKAALDAAGR
ncbi:MAG: hypothetical protein RLZZ111_1322 [Planctomycetota bacterium]